jgi:hypothetical protein
MLLQIAIDVKGQVGDACLGMWGWEWCGCKCLKGRWLREVGGGGRRMLRVRPAGWSGRSKVKERTQTGGGSGFVWREDLLIGKGLVASFGTGALRRVALGGMKLVGLHDASGSAREAGRFSVL